MQTRRFYLATLVSLLVATAAHRAPAATGSVEASGYGGAAEGDWACGPRTQARYGGVGAGVALHPAPPDPLPAPMPLAAPPTSAPGDVTLDNAEAQIGDPEALERSQQGLAVEVAGAVENRSYQFVSADPEFPDDKAVPPAGLRGTGSFKAGWDWRVVGGRIGAYIYPHFKNNDSTRLSYFGLPSLDVRIGNRRTTSVHFGSGSYDPALVLRPAFLYVGVHNVFENQFELQAYGALMAVSDAGIVPRLDVRGFVPLKYSDSGRFDLQLGMAIAGWDSILPEGRLGVRYGF